MKANELRIGNYVDYWFKALDIHEKEYLIQNGADIQAHENHNVFEPIPLTEEWLLKFGLIKKYIKDELEPDGYMLDDDGKRIYHWVDNGVFNLEIQPNKEIWFELYSHYRHLQYVHQLQNLYFALTNIELKIKES